jgi:RimJ/RimL family protein N-acetyltransferase
MEYIIKTERLGLRNWQLSDIEPFVEMGKDEAVMQHFPKLLSEKESKELIERLQLHFITFGYCYFAVDVLETGEFIGFTGLMNQTWESKFTPCVDIGWRLKKSAWGKGYATEAAQACLNSALIKFGIKEVVAFATDTNLPSQNVMKKIDMNFIGTVQHPLIKDDSRFKHCVVYKR